LFRHSVNHNTMSYNILAYACYLLITIYVVVVVGNILHKNGRPFILSVFHGNQHLADSINNMLLVGYYLLNIGYCIITLRIWEKIGLIRELIEIVSEKVGIIVLLLGIMHLFNIIVLLITEKKHRKNLQTHP